MQADLIRSTAGRPSRSTSCLQPRVAPQERLRQENDSGSSSRYQTTGPHGRDDRFDSPSKLCGSTGLCPRVHQSGERDHRGSLAKDGPKYLRWALIEAAVHAASSPVYRDRYQRTAKRLGRQRGKKVARVDIARKLAEAVWYMLTRNQSFAPAGATTPLAA